MSAHKAVLVVICGLVVAAALASALSIENEPVKVTHRNSGPRYDIDEVERTKLTNSDSTTPPNTNTNNENQSQNNPEQNGQPLAPGWSEHDAPMGRVSIRRIFLVPMMAPSRSDWSPNSGNEPNSDEHDSHGPPSSLARPMWPSFMGVPAVTRHHHHHLFGEDAASRSSSGQEQPLVPMATGEREEPPRPPMEHQPSAGPLIQMMLDIMHQALSAPGPLNPIGGGQGGAPTSPFFTDLNKEASAPKIGDGKPSDDNDNDNNNNKPGELDRPVKPVSQNETKEDIVEIDGKKYLRKTIINRHVGENIIFMTKRLIFVPLNETDSAEMTTTTTTTTTPMTADDAATSTTMKPAEMTTNVSEETTEKSASTDDSTRTTGTPVTANTESATTDSTTPETQPSTTNVASELPTTTGKETESKDESWVDRVSEAIDKAAERLILQPSSSTVKPVGQS